MYINDVKLCGNLTRDIEMKKMPSGKWLGEFGLAMNRKWKDRDGTKKEEATFIDCVAFAEDAETLVRYVKKGSPLYVAGELRQDRWEDKTTGKPRSRLYVVVRAFQFVPTGAKSESTGGGKSKPAPVQDTEPQDDAPPVQDKDIPF